MTSRAIALKHFKKTDPHFHDATRAYHSSLPVRLVGKRTRNALFERLVRTVISQQLGVAAARSIFARVKKVCNGTVTPDIIMKKRLAAFRNAGLSAAKIKTLKTIARAVKQGELDLVSLGKSSEADATEKLLGIWGLGPWSAEMFLLFALGRGDVFSPGDLGLVRAIEALYGLPKGASREKLLAIAQKWSPHRTYASLLLWLTRDAKDPI
ncbi:TPA: hypothetical protein DIV48_00455 [Candidatus Kaiserbacteria bacterium]|nr:MAG: HhH-GPD family protein [Parcubacteria group bacterium GW2011_GWA1_56_13]KKW46036.1 MAG: HhH-GPD family protein [Parcubacteria group bacterium GW2011_GWB1_57_6]HCR52103.1 hypothetical protein [Candidatus Kaiserbacteria bacterium]